MTSRRKSDPLVAEIERALRPGEFIRYGETFEFVRGLEEVGARLAALVDAGDAKRAVPLNEILLSGCYEKMEECDDYGLCYDIEKDVAKVLDRDGYRLFAGHFQAAIDRGLAKLEDKQVRPKRACA